MRPVASSQGSTTSTGTYPRRSWVAALESGPGGLQWSTDVSGAPGLHLFKLPPATSVFWPDSPVPPDNGRCFTLRTLQMSTGNMQVRGCGGLLG